MLQRIERLAHISVARGCAFAGLAILTFMIGLSGNMVVSLKTGGVLCLGVCLVLVLKAWLARLRSYKRTEVWLMLSPEERPGSEIAQRVIGTALCDTCLRFALLASRLAIGLLSAAMLYALIVIGQP
jgi:hypothetical protein